MTPRRRRILWGIAAGYWLVLFVMTHLPRRQAITPPSLLGDKAVHGIAYFGLGLMVGISVWVVDRNRRRWAARSLLILWAYAVVDELLQIPVGRDCEFLDWVADAIGSGCAIGFLSLTFRVLGIRSRPDVENARPETAGA